MYREILKSRALLTDGNTKASFPWLRLIGWQADELPEGEVYTQQDTVLL